MNARQGRIRDLLRQASATSVKREDEFIPRLVRREPREHSLPSRLEALDSLTRMRGGIGRPTRKAVKLLLAEIRTTAAAQNASGELQDPYQELLNRADEIESRLKSLKVRREKHKELSEAEVNQLLATAKPPFEAPPGFKWQFDIVDGKVEWWFVSPVRFHLVIKKKESPDGTTRLSTSSAV